MDIAEVNDPTPPWCGGEADVVSAPTSTQLRRCAWTAICARRDFRSSRTTAACLGRDCLPTRARGGYLKSGAVPRTAPSESS